MKLGSALIAVVALQLLMACSGPDTDGADASLPTYHRDIAPLLAEHCGSCHSESGVAPFSVFDYADVRRQASRIARRTGDRSMPPWLPAPGYVDYLNDPSLTDGEIDLIARWVGAGALEGRRPSLFGGRSAAKEWELGEPDLELQMSEGYVLQPSSTDEYRVFVVPVPVSSTKYVRAVDFHPIVDLATPPDSTASDGTSLRMPLHHVVVMIDPTRSSRRLDAEDSLPGYEGTSPMSGAHPPEGFFVGWTPGKRPSALPEGLSWRIDPGTDLVIQTHLQPTSQAVNVSASIGLYFAADPPTRLPSSILLSSISIDIPPDDSSYVVEDSYRLPVDVDVLSVYPHAHFLAKQMQLFATLPDGERRWLLRIEDWDFDWQNSYRLREAMHLPAGSVLQMRYTYDNSSENPQNPHDPPVPTTFGQRSTDEMAELTLQVLTTDPADREDLERGVMEHGAQTLVDGALSAVHADPESPRAQFNLGLLLHRIGRREEAIAAYRRALSLGGDDDPDVHVELGNALAESGAYADGIGHLRRAIELDPEYAQGHFSLGRALEAQGATTEAESHYRRAVELLPGHADAHAGLGRILRDRGRLAEAETELRRALEISPYLAPVRFDLANLLAGTGRAEEAIDHYEAALDLAPTLVAAHVNLARTYQLLGRLEDAAEHYGRTVELEPENAAAHLALGNVLRATGHSPEALEHLRTAARLEPGAAEPMLALAWALATDPDAEIRDPRAAVRLAQDAIGAMGAPDARALATLAAAHGAAGDFDAALARGREALDLARRTGDTAMARSIEAHLELYGQGRPYLAR